MDICLRVLKESNKSSSTASVVTNSVLIISHITFRDCRVRISSDNLSRNSCIWQEFVGEWLERNKLLKLKSVLKVHCFKILNECAYDRCARMDFIFGKEGQKYFFSLAF